MKKDFIDNITSIIDEDSSLSEKRMKLRQEKSHRRGRNRIIISVIINMLQEYSLPLNFGDKLNIHDSVELSDKEYDILLAISCRSSCLYFSAVCFEFVWSHYHRIDLAEKSMNLYLDILKIERDDSRKAAFVTAICRIYSVTKLKKFDIEGFHQFCLESLIPKLSPSGRWINTILKSLMLGSKSNVLEEYILKLIKSKESQKEYFDIITLTEILIDGYKRERRNIEKQTWMSNLAKYHELAADLLDWNDSKNALKITHLIQKSMQIWSDSGNPSAGEERKRLAKRIEPVKKLSLESLQSVSSREFDLTDIINEIYERVKCASLEECIWKFVHVIGLITPKDLKARYENNDLIFSTFFGTTVLDADGRIKCIVPPLQNASPDEEKIIWEYEAGCDYSIYADAVISRYLHIIREYFSFSEDNLKFIVDNNAFIPEDRKRSFLKGLVAGFNFDYITALSILMPQVENAIRCLARICGAVVYKTKDKGLEECLSLETILKLPEIEDCLDPIFLFNLKVFYTSDYGFAMRNTVGHGLMSDAELSSSQGLIVWWFTLYICCIYSPEFKKRLYKQIKKE